jgi:CRP/FNR family transcriptional regulator, anaerobic regulatory protein
MCIAGGHLETLQQTGATFTPAARAQPGQRDLHAHDHLYFEGDRLDHIFIIQSGWAKLYRTLVDGQRQVVGFASPGSILGLESDGFNVNGCEAITPLTVRVILAARISDLCAREPNLAEQLLRQVGRQLGAAQAQLAMVGAQSAEQKLAAFLLSTADLCDAGDIGEFDLPMRRGDMAEFLGLRLETVSRKITDFQRRGWIVMTSLYRCRIVRRAILEELAAGGEAADGLHLRAC